MFQAETGPRWGILGLFLVLSLARPAAAELSDSQYLSPENLELLSAELARAGAPVPVETQASATDASEHYLIDENTAALENTETALAPIDLFEASYGEFKKAVKGAVDLVKWVKMAGPLDPPAAKYNRRTQFGTWKRDRVGGNCMDARAEVLERTSLEPITTRQSGSGRCVVVSGRWVDPYSDEVFTVASEVQIDHMVPLKNAYLSGAWKWDNKKRCQYFNFTSTEDHLLAVSGSENASKGDSSPADYLPPKRAYQCEYLRKWLSVKAVWALALGGDEADAIRDQIHQLGCDEASLRVTTAEVTRLRALIVEGTHACN